MGALIPILFLAAGACRTLHRPDDFGTRVPEGCVGARLMPNVAPAASCADCGRCARATAGSATTTATVPKCLARLRLAVLSPLEQPHLLGPDPTAAHPAAQTSSPAPPPGSPDYLHP